MAATAAKQPAQSGLELLVVQRIGHFNFIAAGIHRRPAGTIAKPASADNVDAAFNVIHLRLVERGYEALNFEIGECNFFLCHTISEVSVNKTV